MFMSKLRAGRSVTNIRVTWQSVSARFGELEGRSLHARWHAFLSQLHVKLELSEISVLEIWNIATHHNMDGFILKIQRYVILFQSLKA